MFCRDCGNKLSLKFLEAEGLVPWCENCGKFKFPFFPVAVCMVVERRSDHKILLARHNGEDEFKLVAGYVKKGESAEKTIARELKEETRLTAIRWKYLGSRYHDAKNVLLLGYLVTAEVGEIVLGEELAETRWCTPEEAKALILKGSSAENFLGVAIQELKRKK
ncbi:MAG: NUDIX domain-containing protein [Clostridia bacterium]|nr:NUDIX domain-containing protein [Clostridia bacterium]